MGYAAPGTWPHAARDWRGGRVVFPHTTPDGRVVNLYGRAVGTAEQVPKAKCSISEMKTTLTSRFSACLLGSSSENHDINCETEH